MSVNLEGQIKGINLTNFLQIVQMEKPTCTLIIRTDKKKGALYIQDGEIIDAGSNTKHKHLDAAFEILSWEDSSIELKKTMEKTEKQINMPLMNILMEAARFKDEKNDSGIDGEFEEEEIDIFDDEFILEGEEAGDDLDSVSLVLDDDYNNQVGVQEIPDEILLEEISPDGASNEPEYDVDRYDLGAELRENTSKVADFTESIGFDDEKTSGFPETESLYPSIEDYIEKKKPWKKIIIISIVSVLIIAAGAISGLLYIKDRNIGLEYQAMEQSLGKMQYEEQQINLLKQFINKYSDSKYGIKARSELNSIINRSQKESFNILIKRVEKLKIDSDYKERAEKYYDTFLQKYPEGSYADRVKSKKNKIPEIIMEHEFKSLKNLSNENFSEKLLGLKEFKKKHPGIHSDEITKIIEEMGDYYLKVIESELKDCTTLESFTNCVKKAKIFKKIFPGHPSHFKAQKLIKTLEKSYWADALLKTAKDKSSNIMEEKKFLKDYISQYNEYSVTIAAQERIREIDDIIREEKKFNSIMEHSSNSTYPIENRINRLKAYIYSNISKDHRLKANKKLKELEAIRSRLVKSLANKEENIVVQEKTIEVKEDKIRYTITNALKEAKTLMGKIADSKRFISAGEFSFTDTLTGKTWTIVNSDVFTNIDCIYYKKAKELAENLELDGYSDWRLPTEQELITLFKNKPFFPVVTNNWFWSSNVFERGLNTYSGVVTDEHIQKRQKIVKNIFYDCGVFKAVRP